MDAELGGHATEEERSRFVVLESGHEKGLLVPAEIRELALLWLEPGHDGDRSVQLLTELIRIEPSDSLARLWLAYCYIETVMSDEALRTAIEHCDEILRRSADGRLRAGALLLKGDALRSLGDRAGARKALEEAVALEPTWIMCRQLLAAEYADEGRVNEALDQLEHALAEPAFQPLSHGHAEHLFEWLITARASEGVKELVREQMGRIVETKKRGE